MADWAMGELFAGLPKTLVAFFLIAGGIIFLILYQPPHTICDSQVEVLNKNQRKFLYKSSKSKLVTSSRYKILREQCFNTNTPGGCYELFHELKTMLYDLKNLSEECSAVVSDVSEYRRAIWDSTDLLVMLAWGRHPPVSPSAKFGWLEVSDISLYCSLKERIIAMYGEAEWRSYWERKMLELPGAKELSRNQVWELSLFSENCSRYP